MPLSFKRFPQDTSIRSKADQIIDLHISKSFSLEVSNEINNGNIFFLGGPISSFDNLKRLSIEKGNFINVDKGYFRKKQNKFWRLTYNKLQQDQIFEVPDDRLKQSFPYILEDWKTNGDYILILAPNIMPLKFYTEYDDIIKWCLDTKEEILKYTDRKIFIRFKDNIKRRGIDPLSKYLKSCHAVVSLQSIACIESISAGVPTFNLSPSCLDGLYKSDISKIENPPRPDNRYEWLKSLAYSQYTLEEIENGTAKSILQTLYHF